MPPTAFLFWLLPEPGLHSFAHFQRQARCFGAPKLTWPCLLGALVDLLEEDVEDGPRQQPVDGGPESHDLVVALLLVDFVQVFELQVPVHLLHLGHFRVVPKPVVRLERAALLLGDLELAVRLAEQPPALLVLNVRAYFPNHLFGGVAVEVVVLRLEVDPHHHEDLSRVVVRLLVLDAKHDHAERDRAVERVERRLVLDDESPAVDREVLDGQVEAQSVQQLPALRLERGLKEEVNELHVVLLAAEVALEHLEHQHLDEERVVDGDLLHVGQFVPAGLPAAGHRVVHDVVRHEQPRLHPLDGPAQHGEAADFLRGQLLALELCQLEDALDHHEAAVHLAAFHVVAEHVLHPLHLVGGHLVQERKFLQHLGHQHVVDFHERRLLVAVVPRRVSVDVGEYGFTGRPGRRRSCLRAALHFLYN
mmetsp:Transcript_66872/g.131171  ORF Transcript_66872/g.131171 Transcript_66872/m.131171 type:complete len:420 (+) Transcript_66872:192-1451(+)